LKAGGKKASALAWNSSDPAPVLLASGRDREAARIISAAREAGVAVVEDPGLAALLDAAEPGDYIPPWCWEAAAKVLAFVFNMEEYGRPDRHT
jgi:flagellar biosynthesis protein